MIGVKEAVHRAREYLASIQGEIGEEINNILLEEVELSPDEKSWLVTLGYDISLLDYRRSPFEIAASGTTTIRRQQRFYKIFDIDAVTGVVKSMKIRNI
jgi:hypothetical protein